MTKFDWIAFMGVLLIGTGLYLAWPPLSFIVTGAILFVVGLLGARGHNQ